MAINTLGIVALGLEITGRHSRDLFQCPQIILGDVVVVIVCATDIGACICAVEVKDIA